MADERPTWWDNQLPQRMAVEEIYGPAMEITDQAEADHYFARLVERLVAYFHKPHDEAADLVRRNLGYYAGYYDSDEPGEPAGG